MDNGGQDNIIQGNYSGVGADGVTPVGNSLHGIVLRSDDNLAPPLGPGQANEPAVSGNIIGLNPNTDFSGLGNLVEFNGTAGIAVFGNPPQNNGTQTQNNGNSILGNSVFENARLYQSVPGAPLPLLGIDLTNSFVFPRDDGFTANDSKGHGAVNDPNNFQNFPILTSVTQVTGGVQIAGTFTEAGEPNTTLRIEFYANNPDPLGQPAEGQTFLGAVNVTTNGSGVASFSATLNATVAVGQIITADATNLTADPSSPGATALFDTSEFSPGLPVQIVVGEFPPYGVMELIGPNNWKALTVTGVNASLLAVSANGAIFGEFPGYGVEQYQSGTSWQPLTVAGVNASLLAADAQGHVFGDFPGYGVNEFVAGTTWNLLHPVRRHPADGGGQRQRGGRVPALRRHEVHLRHKLAAVDAERRQRHGAGHEQQRQPGRRVPWLRRPGIRRRPHLAAVDRVRRLAAGHRLPGRRGGRVAGPGRLALYERHAQRGADRYQAGQRPGPGRRRRHIRRVPRRHGRV